MSKVAFIINTEREQSRSERIENESELGLQHDEPYLP